MDRREHVEDLARRASLGDTDALHDLLVACQPDIRAFARRSCTAGEDVEEAVQQTLIAVYRHVGTFRRASKFTTWLFTVVRNECSRLWRARRRTRPDPVADRADAHLDDLDRLEIIELLVRAIERLPDRLRPTYVLREVEGLTTAETAEALGLTTSNVKVQLHRAREHLRRDLETELGSGPA